MTRRAACSCGQLRLEIEGEPSRVSMCHCLECQRRTGAVISNQARFHREQITFAGQATAWSRKAESGNALTFISVRHAAPPSTGRAKAFPDTSPSPSVTSPIQNSQRRPLRCGRSHATPGSHCHPTLQQIAWQSRAEIRTSISGPGHSRQFPHVVAPGAAPIADNSKSQRAAKFALACSLIVHGEISGNPEPYLLNGVIFDWLRFIDSNLAKVGVEGSNPFARSSFFQ